MLLFSSASFMSAVSCRAYGVASVDSSSPRFTLDDCAPMIPSKSRGIPVLQITTEAYRSLTVFRRIREQIHHDAVTTVKLHEVEARPKVVAYRS